MSRTRLSLRLLMHSHGIIVMICNSPWLPDQTDWLWSGNIPQEKKKQMKAYNVHILETEGNHNTQLAHPSPSVYFQLNVTETRQLWVRPIEWQILFCTTRAHRSTSMIFFCNKIGTNKLFTRQLRTSSTDWVVHASHLTLKATASDTSGGRVLQYLPSTVHTALFRIFSGALPKCPKRGLSTAIINIKYQVCV